MKLKLLFGAAVAPLVLAGAVSAQDAAPVAATTI